MRPQLKCLHQLSPRICKEEVPLPPGAFDILNNAANLGVTGSTEVSFSLTVGNATINDGVTYSTAKTVDFIFTGI